MRTGLNYYYLAPIIASERSKITSREVLRKSAYARTLSEFKDQISSFFPELEDHSKFRTLDEIHWLFQNVITEAFFKIIKNSPEIDHDFLEVFLVKFEIQNIKTILRSKVLNLEPEEIKRDLNFPIEEFFNRASLFHEALETTGIDNLINIFETAGSFYTPYLKKARQWEQEVNALGFFDLYLDHSQLLLFWEEFNHLSYGNRKAIKPFLLLFTEYYNLIIILRGKIWNLDPIIIRELVLPYYYSLSEEITDIFIEKDNLQELVDYIYDKHLNEKIPFFKFESRKDLTGISVIDTIKKTYYKETLRFIIRNKGFRFDIRMPVCFFLEKKFEMQDLKTISTGIDYGLDPKVLIENSILLTLEQESKRL